MTNTGDEKETGEKEEKTKTKKRKWGTVKVGKRPAPVAISSDSLKVSQSTSVLNIMC